MAGRRSPAATRAWVTSRSSRCSHSRAVAPRSTASAAWRCPSVWAPGTQQNSEPVPDPSAVELDGADLGRGRIATHLDRVDVVEQRRHLHRAGVQGFRSAYRYGRDQRGPTYGPSVVAPVGTEMVPVPPTAEFEAEVVAVAVVGMP